MRSRSVAALLQSNTSLLPLSQPNYGPGDKYCGARSLFRGGSAGLGADRTVRRTVSPWPGLQPSRIRLRAVHLGEAGRPMTPSNSR